ncbi:MAG TPA: c-type cytochrome [Azoarcus sp.]|nr:c-type cytochrome [Azoarcus sp.]
MSLNHPVSRISLVAAAVATIGLATLAKAETQRFEPTLPEPKEGQYIHTPPTMEDLEASSLHPELKRVIRKGRDMFINTQQYRGEYVFNDMNCSSCHLDEGRLPYSAPVWPAAVLLPNYRPKNDHVNSLEERIAGCFSFSMNGKPPAYGSDDMLAISAYHQWLATGAPMYSDGSNIYGRGYGRLPQPPETPDVDRGKALYAESCAICHGDQGEGLRNESGEAIFPAVWGDTSYNWGAGISRIFTLAAFIKYNMPYGQPGRLTDQQAWDVAQYINSRERPQDPRYEGNAVETRERYLETFHKHTLYGTEFDGRILGEHQNVGEKDFLKPDVLKPRTFE